ncbi:MAG: PD-(D/E)XK nuclease family protein [Collinsella aerofaciens]
MPRLTSASQIQAYSTCPLCWFVSYRVKPQSIDAGFGNMEKGNFVHDVLEHLHARLPQEGMERVTPENLPRAQELLHEVFDETLAEHAGKRGTEGPLVPLSPVEERQVAEILPQLEGVLAYESEALTPFAPRYLEIAFNELQVEYAGWPLGGRIDRVDVDAENRAVVIDYKHRSGVEEFKLADPTVRDEESGEAPIDDPRWRHHIPKRPSTPGHAPGAGFDTRAALYFSTKLRWCRCRKCRCSRKSAATVASRASRRAFQARAAAWTSMRCSIAWRPASPSACASSRRATSLLSTRRRRRPRMPAARITTKERL